MAENLIPAAEFQALPLSYIVAEPLKAAVDAQAIAAKTTQNFIEGLLKDGKPTTVDFRAAVNAGTDASGQAITKEVQVSAPLLAMVPVPHLRIDSLTVHFKYEISAIDRTAQSTDRSGEVNVSSGSMLSPWVQASLKGSVASRSSSESVMNRSGILEITINASEAPMPEGLAKIIGILNNAITVS